MSLALTPSASAGSSVQQALAVDVRSLNALKAQANQGDAQATQAASKEAAKQLESLFMRELIKSMRAATMKSGLLDGAESDLATDLFDQQLSVQMSGLPGGLSDAIQRQLARQLGGEAAPDIVPGATLRMDVNLRNQPTAAPQQAGDAKAAGPKGRDNFVNAHRAAAERVAQSSGIPASFMLGQAGHETGWGKGEIRNKDGSNSFNLFGIKAGKGWTGKVAEVTTTEYVNGVARKQTAKFRAYDSFEESFKDYARLINNSPRYEQARAKVHSAQAYAAELQKAGYATDPQYAAKLSRAIQSTLSVARAPGAAGASQA